MFPFQALQTFRVSSLSFEFHTFPDVFLCGLQIISKSNQIKLKIKKYTFANQKRFLKFTACAKKFVFNECLRRKLRKVLFRFVNFRCETRQFIAEKIVFNRCWIGQLSKVSVLCIHMLNVKFAKQFSSRTMKSIQSVNPS